MIRNEREHVCDDVVLDYFPDKLSYVKALSAMEELDAMPPKMAPAIMKKRSLLFQRITRVMKTQENKYRNFGSRLSALFVMVLIISITASAAIRFGEHEKRFADETFSSMAPITLDRINEGELSAELPSPLWVRNRLIVVDEKIEPDTLNQRKKAEYRAQNEKERQEAIEAYKEAKKAEMEAYRQLREVLGEEMEDLSEEFRVITPDIHEFESLDSLKSGAYIYSDPGANIFWHRGEDFKWADPGFWKEFDVKADSLVKGYHYRFDTSLMNQFNDELFEKRIILEKQAKELQEQMEDLEGNALQEWYSDKYLDELEERMHEHEDLIEEYVRPEVYIMPRENYFWKRDAYPHGPKTERIIRQELIRDGLIEPHGDYIIELNGKNMIINGEKQSRSTYKKYKRLYESLEESEMGDNEEFRLVL
jgi:cell division protein FtsB